MKNTKGKIANKEISPRSRDWSTFQSHVDYFNRVQRAMLDAPTLYLVGKDGPDTLLRSIQKDLEQTLVTSTVVRYTGVEQGEIIHNYGSLVVTPTMISDVRIPITRYGGIWKENSAFHVASLQYIPEGLDFLQAVFDTHDSGNEISHVLSRLSGHHFFRVNTLSEEKRRELPATELIRPLTFTVGPYNNWFDAPGEGTAGYDLLISSAYVDKYGAGRSRGVKIN